MNAVTQTPDPVVVRTHMAMLHGLAAAAKVDGILVLASYGEDPTTGEKITPRVPHFAIGDVNGMTDAALSLCQDRHRNVYAPWAILRKDLGRNKRGELSDIRAVLGLVADQDADHGKAGITELPLDAPYVIRSSSGNLQPVYPLARALSVKEAKPIAEALAASVGGDDGTKDVDHVWRVPGCLNWPNKEKVRRGRPHEPQIVTVATPWSGELIDGEALRAAAAAAAAKRKTGSGNESKGDGPPIDTGEFERRNVEYYRDLLLRAKTDGKKHHAVVRLAASLARQGVKREMTEALIGEICPVWDSGVVAAIDSGYKKFFPDAGEHQPLFKPWATIDLAAIPAPDFVYSDFYARGYTSVTVAPPKVGKSMLGLAEAIDMATGRGILTGYRRPPLKVVYYNAEDDQDVLDSRVAALLTHYRIDQHEIEGQLFVTSGVERPDFYLVSGQEGAINEALFTSIEEFCIAEAIDVIKFDPLQDLSRSPETNEIFRLLGARLRLFAARTRAALGLTHHTRKGSPGVAPSIDDMRGGGALRGTARFNRILIGMTEGEGTKARVQNHRHFFRIGDMESNLAPPSADVNRWFEKRSVTTPNGHSVGAIVSWKWPDAFAGVSTADALRVQQAVASQETPLKASVQAKDWVGFLVAEVLGLSAQDRGDKARISEMLKTWIANDVLRADTVYSTRDARDIPVIVAGENRLDQAE